MAKLYSLEENYKQELGERLTEGMLPNANGCWIWQRVKCGNYGGLYVRGHKMVGAHRVSWCVFHGKIPKDQCILHRCDNTLCINPFHLFLGTHGENAKDRTLKARHPKHISDTTIREAHKARHIYKWSYKEISLRYGISALTASRIAKLEKKRYRELIETACSSGAEK